MIPQRTTIARALTLTLSRSRERGLDLSRRTNCVPSPASAGEGYNKRFAECSSVTSTVR